jgi:UDP-3-O-[3-hydroxymyristoyl] N-acetylglucosamine deacetylase
MTGAQVPALAAFARRRDRTTCIHRGAVSFQPVEHLLAALAASGVNHVYIEVDGGGVPICDGSAGTWADAIESAGTRPLGGYDRALELRQTIHVGGAQRWVRALPAEQPTFRYTLDYPGVPIQTYEIVLSQDEFRRNIAPARTFCGVHERGVLADSFRSHHVVVFDRHGKPDRLLRFPNEPVRHKILDLIGDLCLVGRPIKAMIEARASGHALHIELAEALTTLVDERAGMAQAAVG